MALLIYTLSVRLLLCALFVDAVYSRSSLGIYRMISRIYIFTFVLYSFDRQTKQFVKYINNLYNLYIKNIYIRILVTRLQQYRIAIRRYAGLSIHLTDSIEYIHVRILCIICDKNTTFCSK